MVQRVKTGFGDGQFTVARGGIRCNLLHREAQSGYKDGDARPDQKADIAGDLGPCANGQ
jgi:hypothetical protein